MKHMTAFRARCAEIFAAMLLTLAACGGGGGGGGGAVFAPVLPAAPAAPTEPAAPATPPPTATPSAARKENFSINSTFNNTTYPIEVYLPAGHDTSPGPWPTVYILDGDSQLNFNESRFANFRAILLARKKKAILVGIGNTRNRGVDYTMPGGLNYHNFLVKELVPLIESRYRASPAKRMLSGHSLSGSYVAAALFIEARAPISLFFTHFLSSDGAFHSDYLRQVDELEQQVYTTIGTNALPVDLLMARGTGSSANDTAVKAFYNRLLLRQYKGLRLTETQFPLGHGPMDIPAFEDAVDRFID